MNVSEVLGFEPESLWIPTAVAQNSEVAEDNKHDQPSGVDLDDEDAAGEAALDAAAEWVAKQGTQPSGGEPVETDVHTSE